MNPEFFRAACLSDIHAFHCLGECPESRMDTDFQADTYDNEYRGSSATTHAE